MDIKLEISETREATLDIEVSVEEVNVEFDKSLNMYRKKVNVPGFRRGKTPISLIKKRFGKDIFAETIQQVMQDFLEIAVKEKELDPAGQIDITMIEGEQDKPLKFQASFPIRPEISIDNYKKMQLLISDAEVTDEDVEKRINAFRQKYAVLRSVDTPAPAEARLTVKVQEVDPSGVTLIGKPVEEKTIEFGTDLLGVGSDEQLLGISAGEKRTISVRQISNEFVDTIKQSSIITPDQASKDAAQPQEVFLSVEVDQVEVPELPEIDEEFVKLVNDKVESVEDLKKWIKGSLMAYVEVSKQQLMEKAIVNRLIEDNPFVMSPEIVEGPLKELADEWKLEGDERETFMKMRRANTERDYRWVYLYNEIAKIENIYVSDEEFEQEMVKIAEASGDSLQVVQRKMGNEEAQNRFRRRLTEKLVVQFIAKQAEIEYKKTSLDEFVQATDQDSDYNY